MPPLGEPIELAEAPEITIPQATYEEEASIPIAGPEARLDPKPIEEKPKPEEKPDPTPAKPKESYQGTAQQSDKDQTGGNGTDVSDQVGPGTKFGSVAVDNADFQYPYYFVQALGKIQRNWTNPVASNQPLSCVIYFQIIRTGSILDPKVEQSSGIPAYDRACLRALQLSSPLPQLPSDFGSDIIGMYLEFPYNP
jgi:outer membrane biosynthesis protein TonB